MPPARWTRPNSRSRCGFGRRNSSPTGGGARPSFRENNPPPDPAVGRAGLPIGQQAGVVDDARDEGRGFGLTLRFIGGEVREGEEGSHRRLVLHPPGRLVGPGVLRERRLGGDAAELDRPHIPEEAALYEDTGAYETAGR